MTASYFPVLLQAKVSAKHKILYNGPGANAVGKHSTNNKNLRSRNAHSQFLQIEHENENQLSPNDGHTAVSSNILVSWRVSF